MYVTSCALHGTPCAVYVCIVQVAKDALVAGGARSFFELHRDKNFTWLGVNWSPMDVLAFARTTNSWHTYLARAGLLGTFLCCVIFSSGYCDAASAPSPRMDMSELAMILGFLVVAFIVAALII